MVTLRLTAVLDDLPAFDEVVDLTKVVTMHSAALVKVGCGILVTSKV